MNAKGMLAKTSKAISAGVEPAIGRRRCAGTIGPPSVTAWAPSPRRQTSQQIPEISGAPIGRTRLRGSRKIRQVPDHEAQRIGAKQGYQQRPAMAREVLVVQGTSPKPGRAAHSTGQTTPSRDMHKAPTCQAEESTGALAALRKATGRDNDHPAGNRPRGKARDREPRRRTLAARSIRTGACSHARQRQGR